MSLAHNLHSRARELVNDSDVPHVHGSGEPYHAFCDTRFTRSVVAASTHVEPGNATTQWLPHHNLRSSPSAATNDWHHTHNCRSGHRLRCAFHDLFFFFVFFPTLARCGAAIGGGSQKTVRACTLDDVNAVAFTIGEAYARFHQYVATTALQGCGIVRTLGYDPVTRALVMERVLAPLLSWFPFLTTLEFDAESKGAAADLARNLTALGNRGAPAQSTTANIGSRAWRTWGGSRVHDGVCARKSQFVRDVVRHGSTLFDARRSTARATFRACVATKVGDRTRRAYDVSTCRCNVDTRLEYLTDATCIVLDTSLVHLAVVPCTRRNGIVSDACWWWWRQ